jgi:hypothetical protein
MPARSPLPKLHADGSLVIDLGLSKQERMLPAWQTDYGLEVPAAAEFDYDQAVARLQKCCYSGGYIHSPENAGIPASMTREEAWFWLQAMSGRSFQPHKIAGKKAWKAPTASQVMKLLNDGINSSDTNSPSMRSVLSDSWYPELVAAVTTLLSPEEMVDFIRANCTAFEHSAFSQYNAGFGHFLAGCCMHLTPYLSLEQSQKLGEPFIDLLRRDPDLTSVDGITALAVLAVFGNTGMVTETLRRTKSKIIPSCHWLFARVESQSAYEELIEHLKPRFEGVYSARLVLAASGASRLDHLRACLTGLKPDQQRVMKTLRRVLHPGIAPLMLEQRSRHKEAAAWLRENVLHATVGLAPHAAGADEHTPAAKMFWQELWQSQPEIARQSLEWVADDARPALERMGTTRSICEQQASESLPEELTKVLSSLKRRPAPSWLAVGALPAITVRGVPLMQAQVQGLIHGWKSSKDGNLPPWSPLLTRWADAGSLQNFARHLFEQWLKEGCPAADAWVLLAACMWGSEDFHLRLSRFLVYRPLDSPWPHSRACAGVRALAAAATPVAISQLYRLAHATHESMQRAEARKMLEKAAESHGVHLEQLADAHVPTAGFGLAGRRVFEANGLTLEARINDRFELRFLLPDGKESRRLPPNAHALDPTAYLRLCAECRRARRLLRDTWEVQILRTRQAIAQDYQRTTEHFEQQILRHPLLSRLARQLVWQVVPENGTPVAFRPAEYGSLIDVQHLTITLPAGSRVRLASPAGLSQEEVRGWIEHLADHQIIQPVKQFAALACLPLPAELNKVKVNRFTGAETTIGQLKAAFAQEQWSHDKPQEDGGYTRHFRAFPAGKLYACVRHSRVWLQEENWRKENLDERPAEIEDVWFIPDHFPKKEWRNSKHYLAIRDVPPAIFSEVFSLLHRMTGVPVPESTS